jgi:hypothetical protein
MTLPLSILRVRSRRNGVEFVVGIPSADVDYATDGLLVLTSTEKDELILCMATSEEYALGPDVGARRRAARLREQSGRTDLVPATASFDTPANPAVWSGGTHPPCRFAFIDIFDPSGLADPVAPLSCKEFVDAGGQITDLRNE